MEKQTKNNKITQLRNDIKNAQLNKKYNDLSTFRVALSKLQNYAIEQKKSVDELQNTEVEEVMVKLGKQREESIEAFKKGNREDLVKKEQYELNLLQKYMPQRLSEQETTSAVTKIMQELKIETPNQIGQVMAEIKKSYGNKIDMSIASRIAKEKLA